MDMNKVYLPRGRAGVTEKFENTRVCDKLDLNENFTYLNFTLFIRSWHVVAMVHEKLKIIKRALFFKFFLNSRKNQTSQRTCILDTYMYTLQSTYAIKKIQYQMYFFLCH